MSTRITLQPAFILHQRPYRNTSVLLEVFSPDHGRFGLVGRGVKGKKQNRQALLQAFTPVLLSWSARGELGTLIDVELDGSLMNLSGLVLLSGFYLNELLIHLLHRNDPHPRLFSYYRYVLEQLRDISAQQMDAMALQICLRYFEKRLLQEVGYGMVLDYEVESGEVIEPDQNYRYIIGEGPVKAENLAMTGLFDGASLLAYANETLDSPRCLRDAKRLSRRLLDHHLGGRQLNSRKLMFDLQRNAEAASLDSKRS